MKKTNLILLAIAIALTSLFSLSSCKKGTDDPVISLKTRKDRFTNTWTLNKYEKNGAQQDISGTTYTYLVKNDGTLTQTIEGSIFGFATRSIREGTWTFQNDDEDVKITIGTNVEIYNLQRLATKELWLKNTTGSDTHVYYFDGL
ncbi:MAG: hypothetical protein SGJ00_04150 [bacterium]|nr:hypothetical protein [bacterium]